MKAITVGAMHLSIYIIHSLIHLSICISSSIYLFLGESLMVSLNPERQINSHEPVPTTAPESMVVAESVETEANIEMVGKL